MSTVFCTCFDCGVPVTWNNAAYFDVSTPVLTALCVDCNDRWKFEANDLEAFHAARVLDSQALNDEPVFDDYPVTLDNDDLHLPVGLRFALNPAWSCKDAACTHECNQIPF